MTAATTAPVKTVQGVTLRLEISALEALGDDTAVVRGAGVCGRAGYQGSGPVPVTITSKPEPS